jgi:predicted DNA-binding transcriptional regulator YafY
MSTDEKLLEIESLLRSISSRLEERGVMSVTQFAASVGVSSRTVTHWIEQGMPVCRPGKQAVIDYTTASKWIKSKRITRALTFKPRLIQTIQQTES